MKARIRGAALLALAVLLHSCSDDPSEVEAEFVVSVGNETFVMRVTDAETIRLAQENADGRNH